MSSTGTIQFPIMGGGHGGGCFCGRRGMPREWIDTMYADYVSGMSLAGVAKKYGRTRQSIWDIFNRRGLKLRAPNFKPQLEYKGRKYTQEKNGYWRDTIYRSSKYNPETFLHRRVWIEHNGPIPPGHDVIFKDRNRNNWQIDNLEMITHAEQQARGRVGRNQFTVTAPARLKALLAGSAGAVQLKRRAA